MNTRWVLESVSSALFGAALFLVGIWTGIRFGAGAQATLAIGWCFHLLVLDAALIALLRQQGEDERVPTGFVVAVVAFWAVALAGTLGWIPFAAWAMSWPLFGAAVLVWDYVATKNPRHVGP